MTFERKGCMEPDRFEKVTIYPARDIDTNSQGAIVRISDITEAKLLQKMVAQNEKLSALGLLVSGIAHEINNPNNFITFNIPVLKDHLQALLPITDAHAAQNPGFELLTLPYEEFRQNIFDLMEYIKHGSARINTTVTQLKGFIGYREDSNAVPINLSELLERVLGSCRGKYIVIPAVFLLTSP